MLKYVLIIETIIIFFNAATLSRDYQDSWILEGLELFFTIYMITYLLYFTSERKIIWLIIFALIIRFTILSIPNLKYQWFQGVAIDQHREYRLTLDIYDQGRIREGDLYSGTPSMHLSFVIYSIITGLEIIHSFKYFPILYWFIFPIVIYILIKRIDSKNVSTHKYALFLSSIPVKPSISYFVMGTLYGPLIIFLILHQLISRNIRNNFSSTITFFLYTILLSATHTYSSIAFTLLLIIIYLMWHIVKKIKFIDIDKNRLPISNFDLMFVIIISFLWCIYMSNTFSIVIKSIYKEIVHAQLTESFFYPRIFELGYLDSLKIILVYHGGDIFLIILTLMSIKIIYNKLRTKNSELMLYSLYMASLFLFFIFGYIFDIGWQLYDRTIRCFLVFTPIFSSISLQYIEKKTRNKLVPILLIGIFLVFSTIELYRCQLLVPSASSLSKDLPDDEPIVYVNAINTVYKRHMILHAERFFPYGKTIASDGTTEIQLIGLTNINFSKAHIKYYPLSKEEELTFDFFLIHLPGKSGAFKEKAEFRTKSLISSYIYNSKYNIIYTNSEAYILNTK